MAYRIGLYGCGTRTQQILERALKNGIAKVTLCHDISEANANKLAEKYQAKVCSLDELLSSDEVDMYLISLFPAAHPDALLKAAKRQRRLLCRALSMLTTRRKLKQAAILKQMTLLRCAVALLNT